MILKTKKRKESNDNCPDNVQYPNEAPVTTVPHFSDVSEVPLVGGKTVFSFRSLIPHVFIMFFTTPNY